MQPRRFVLTALDPEYGHPSFETLIVIERPEELRTLLNLSAEEDPGLEMSYRLEAHEAAAIVRHFGVQFASLDRETYLHPWRTLREVPYLVHTGFELALMVDGRKQLTHMMEVYPPEKHFGEDRFDRCVAAGILHKEVELELFPESHERKDGSVLKGMRTVYYTRRGEEWRVQAFRLIRMASGRSGWNEHYERLEGMLFGYEAWQVDWWIDDLRRRNKVFGTIVVWMAVDATTLSGIEFAACRAVSRPTANVRLVFSLDEPPDEGELGSLMEAAEAVALVKFRAKARHFLELIGASAENKPFYELPPELIADLNRLIVGEIEVVARPGRRAVSGVAPGC